MRLVYQNAQRVIIWLGASNSQIDCLFDWMVTLDQQVLKLARPHTISTWENQWVSVVWHLRGRFPPDEIKEALGNLLRRDWFSRIWVLQEAALAKSAMITCGRNEVNSRALVVMPSLLSVSCSEGEQARLDILPGLLRAKAWFTSGSNDLLTLLQKFGRSKASDLRDIIYALLGLSGDAHSSEDLRPNYEIDLEEAIQNCVAYLMRQKNDLPTQFSVQSLPKWSIDTFLDSLTCLTYRVFCWATDHAQDSLLHDLLAIQKAKGDFQIIRDCITYAGPYGPPITVALKQDNLALINLLCQFPDTNFWTQDSDGKTPLIAAVERENLAVARHILGHRQRDVRKSDSGGNTPLLVAVKHRSSILVELLLKNPEIEVNASNLNGDTPLLIAVKQGDSAVVELLLSQPDVNLYEKDSNGDNPLILAARRGDESIVGLLLKDYTYSMRIMTVIGGDGFTPFETALVGGSSWITTKLLAYHLDAVEVDQLQSVRKILDMEPSLLEDSSIVFRTPLGAAAAIGNSSIVSFLLDCGANIHARSLDTSMSTPLWDAASAGHLDTVMLLVERGADVEYPVEGSPTKITALWAAAWNGHTRVVMYLLEVGAKVEAAESDTTWSILKDLPASTRMLWAAVSGGQTKAVRILAEGGVDLDTRQNERLFQFIKSRVYSESAFATPIWVAASLGHTDIVRLLIQHGANVEARSDFGSGMTPFWIAAQQNKPEVMRVLIEGGADIRAKPYM